MARLVSGKKAGWLSGGRRLEDAGSLTDCNESRLGNPTRVAVYGTSVWISGDAIGPALMRVLS